MLTCTERKTVAGRRMYVIAASIGGLEPYPKAPYVYRYKDKLLINSYGTNNYIT